MLSNITINNIKEILKRLSNGEEVSLKERLYIQKQADSDQKVMAWLKKARRLQARIEGEDSIDILISGLDLGSSEENSISKPGPEELGDWFSGAPSWVARS